MALKPNDFCINTKETGCIWGMLSNWDAVNLDKIHTVVFLGKYTEYNGKNYVVLRCAETGTNYIVEV